MNDFKRDLAWANSAAAEPFWELGFRRGRHGFDRFVNLVEDGDSQRNGTDAVVVYKNNRAETWQLKARREDYNDLLWEVRHVPLVGEGWDGWGPRLVQSQSPPQGLAYGWVPSAKLLLFDTRELIEVMLRNDQVLRARMIRSFELKGKPRGHGCGPYVDGVCWVASDKNDGYVSHNMGITQELLFSLIVGIHTVDVTGWDQSAEAAE